MHNLYVYAVLQKSTGNFVYVGKGTTSRVNTALKRTAPRLGHETTRGLVLKQIEVPSQLAARRLEQRLMNDILKRQGGNLTKRGTKYAVGGNLYQPLRFKISLGAGKYLVYPRLIRLQKLLMMSLLNQS